MNVMTKPPVAEPAGAEGWIAHVASDAVVARRDGATLVFATIAEDGGLRLAAPVAPAALIPEALSAVVEALTAETREPVRLVLDCADENVVGHLRRTGLLVDLGRGPEIAPALVWQRPETWLAGGGSDRAFPQFHVVSNGRRHPVRPPKPEGVVYRRRIPWLDKTLTFRALDPKGDLPRFHRWMNDPRVDAVWEEAGDLDEHARSLAERAADPHLLMLIGEFDGEAFGYFELYWAKENRLGPHYDADDYDRGWHVLIGEDAFRGRGCVTAWLPSLMHYMFLADPRTHRIVGEPRATHAQQIRNLERSGFAKIKHFDFPHKRALLVSLLRERFFGDRLWAPEGDGRSE